MSAEKPWTSRLLFNRPRHKTLMCLPANYPLINKFPEWFTLPLEVYPEGYSVTLSLGVELRVKFNTEGVPTSPPTTRMLSTDKSSGRAVFRESQDSD